VTGLPRVIACVVLSGACGALAGGPPAEVRMRESGAGRFLTDARGMSLYLYAQDTQPGKSACVAECAKNWPPLRAPAAAVSGGDWSLIERADGGPQWAWRGRPLYSYARDSYAGGMLGDGAGNNAWRVALDRIGMPPGITLRSMYLGRILADARGRTLYWQRDQDSNCDAGCPESWTPLYAPWLAQPQGDWTLLARKDGQRQWAFRGRRLYLHADDLKPGDTAGLTDDGKLQVAVLHALPALPGWVTVQNSDMGEVFADARGHTLYVFAGQPDQLAKTRQLMCDDGCIRRFWQTIPAAPGTRPAGDWTVVVPPLGGAGQVWAYKGNVLYTHTRDREPGAIGGDKWAAGVGGGGGGWVPLLRRRDFDD
jgi:predicted lipoprotein with Yx(FWY)xxD motif